MEMLVPIVTAAAVAVANTALDESVRGAVGAFWRKVIETAKRGFGKAHEVPVLIERLGEVGGDPAQVESIAGRLEALRIGDDADLVLAIRQLGAELARAGLGPNAAAQQMRDSHGSTQARDHATVNQVHGNTVNVESLTGSVFSFGSQHFHRSN